MIIKVCGMRDADNIREVENLFIQNSQYSIAWMGFIFWPKSKRYVSEKPTYLPSACKRVGVFVDEDIEQVKRIADDFALDIIQLHGSESPEQISQLSALTSHLSIIKALNIATAEDLEQTKAYEGLVDDFLFDTKTQLPGGSGQQFDWNVLNAYDGNTPFLLSGGIGPDDAVRVKVFHHEKCIGIDLNSRFELAPGLKNVNKLKEFLKKIQE
jgi:phosphoribosylanthranilate isomerase